MDKKRIEKAVREILSAVGENPNRSDIKDTPKSFLRKASPIKRARR